MFLKKSKAMSYVELIMVITLIGVVASLTIPSVKKHSQRTELATLAKKAYLTLEDAIDNATVTEGPMRNWDFSSNNTFCSKYLVPNLKTLSSNCAAATFTLKDGMKVDIAECNGNFCHFHVDINGTTKGPNMVGKDFFEFQVNKAKENVEPASYGGADILRRNNWKFTDNLWNCTWTSGGDNSACR